MHQAADIPTIEPTEWRVGETVKWEKDLSAHYPADGGWTLTYTLLNSAQRYTAAGAASGKKFLITLSAATTATYAVGTYSLIGRVSKAGEVFQIYAGTVTLRPDLISAVDTRSHVKKVLDAIEAVIAGTATKEQASYAIGTRSLQRRSIPELLVLRSTYKAEYERELDAEHIARGEGTGKKVLTRFVGAG